MSRRQEICRDFQRGSCRYGARCKFLHLASGQQQQRQPQQNQRFGFGGGGGGSNYYGALGDSSYTQRAATNSQSQQTARDHKCNDPRVCKDQIREDLQNEHPVFWRLTSYAHYKHLPNDIIGDVSPEELRALAYESAKQGLSLKDVAQREASMFAAKNAEFEALLKNPYKGPATSQVSAATFPSFSPVQQNTSTVMVFGQPLTLSNPTPGVSGFGQTPHPFAASSTTSGFGFGHPSGDVTFGSRPSTTAASPFGSQPTNLFQPKPLFPNVAPTAQPSVLQQSGFTASVFGGAQPSVVQQSPFGSPATAGSVPLPVANGNLSPFGLSPSSVGVSPFPAPSASLATPGSSVQPTATPPLSVSNVAAVTDMSMNSSEEEARWYKPVWKIGEIPEEEPPAQVRQ